jgi:hypothetical protein
MLNGRLKVRALTTLESVDKKYTRIALDVTKKAMLEP